MAIDFVSTFDLSAYALFLLSIILVIIFVKKDLFTFENKLFITIILASMLAIIAEALSWVWDGQSGDLASFLNWGFNILYGITPTGITCLWAIYIDYKITGKKRQFKKLIPYLLPFIVVVIIAITNLIVPVVFSIDSSNTYSRESTMWIVYFINYCVYLYIAYITFKNKKIVNQKLLISVVLIFVFPLIGATIQMVFYGLLLIGPMLGLAVAIVYIVLETISIQKDYLTQLNSRSKTDDYINHLIAKDKSFVVVMIDLDDYKKINDKHGHLIGDKVLIVFAQELLSLFKRNSMVARYGGDEFLIVSESTEMFDIKEFKSELYIALQKHQDEHELFASLKFSAGLSVYDPSKNLEHLLVESDNEMYLDKAKSKNKQRRKNDR